MSRQYNDQKTQGTNTTNCSQKVLGKQNKVKIWQYEPTLKSRFERRCSGQVSSSCFTSAIRRATNKRNEYHLIWKVWTYVLYNVYAVFLYNLYNHNLVYDA